MIPQIGFSEMLVLAVLAIIVVGPKDLPKLMRVIGKSMARLRAMGQEFKDAFNDMAAAEEMAELREEIAELRNMGDLTKLGEKEMRELDVELRESVSLDNPKTMIASKGDVAKGDVSKPDSSNPDSSNP